MNVVDDSKNNGPRLGKIAATYDYIDITGELLFQVVRFEPKDFRQRRPKGASWEWSLRRVKPILYRLPELAQAAVVFVPEGEKDVENLRKLDLVATTNPMGAGEGKWRPEFGKHLADKDVIILPDNDDEGRKHAQRVATNCHQHGAKAIRIIQLPVEQEKGDVSDWIALGHTGEELLELARATPQWRPHQDGVDPSWEERLIQGDDGPKAIEANVEIALTSAPELAGKLRFNEFSHAVECHDLPWDTTLGGAWREWQDNDTNELGIWPQKRGIDITLARCDRPIDMVAYRSTYHGPRQYLDSLKWDEVKRLDNWLVFYLGAEPPPDASAQEALDLLTYLRAIGPKFMISAVARIYRPGCQVDTMPVLEGPQGDQKSSALKLLFGGGEWFTDNISPIGIAKAAKEEIAGKWCVELAELSSLQKTDVAKLKSFLTSTTDRYRPAYGRRAHDHPRQCVFSGTTNEYFYLYDTTGNRRFWPVRVGRIDMEALAKDRDQLWAEAVHRYRQGEQWHLTPEEEALARAEQAKREVPDPWFDVVERHLASMTFVTVGAVLAEACGVGKDKWEPKQQARVLDILRKLGWTHGTSRTESGHSGQNRRGWRAPEKSSW